MSLTEQLPVWDNSHIFSSFQDPKIEELFSECEEKIALFEKTSEEVKNGNTESIESTLLVHSDFFPRFWDIYVYAMCGGSTKKKNKEATDLTDRCGKAHSRIMKSTAAINNYIKTASDEDFKTLFSDKSDHLIPMYEYKRKMKDFTLPTQVEETIISLSNEGHHSWNRLYGKLTGSLKFEIDGEEMPISLGSKEMANADQNYREKVFRSINKAWQTHEISFAEILNAINGWRNDEARLRSEKKEYHFLTQACHQAKITRPTLDTLMQTTFERKGIGHKAMALQKKAAGLTKRGPWDLMSLPCPFTSKAEYSFEDAKEIILEAFHSFRPEMAEYAQLMFDRKWIDVRPTENRSMGGYCTRFPSYRESRIFMTWAGTMKSVITLAHEIGHAFHTWALRERPLELTHYSMTLAETASIFAETLVRENLIAKASTTEEKLSILWNDLDSASGFLLNIPARYEFEYNLAKGKKEKSFSAEDFKQMTNEAWGKWYGDSLDEYDEMFWASKLHFHMTGRSFYNYPYLFGYLFSLGIWQTKDQDNFYEKYMDILIDTGYMTANEIITKHLAMDIEKAEFWNKSLDYVESKVNQFEELYNSIA
jgi:oligoendopeptidase F